MGSLDANADFLLSVVQAEVLCLRALSWDGGRHLCSDSITAFISQAAFMPEGCALTSVCQHLLSFLSGEHCSAPNQLSAQE